MHTIQLPVEGEMYTVSEETLFTVSYDYDKIYMWTRHCDSDDKVKAYVELDRSAMDIISHYTWEYAIEPSCFDDDGHENLFFLNLHKKSTHLSKPLFRGTRRW